MQQQESKLLTSWENIFKRMPYGKNKEIFLFFYFSLLQPYLAFKNIVYLQPEVWPSPSLSVLGHLADKR